MPLNVLVTGGAGYIGSHICKALAAAGHVPIAFDDMSNGHLWAVQWGPLVQGDLLDTALLARLLRDRQVNAVVHAAAYGHTSVTTRRPDLHYHVNVGGSLSLLRAMREAQVKAIVLASTAAVYGSPTQSPLSESQRCAPLSSYGASKMMVEIILMDYLAAFGIRYTTLRHFTVAGADPQNEIGAMRKPESHLFPLAMQASLSDTPDFTVYGNRYPTHDGTCIRDYVHVADVAAAYGLALVKLLDGKASPVYNIGSGEGHSVGEVIAAMARVTGKRLQRKDGPNRDGDVPTLVADPSRAKSELKWTPKHSDLTSLVSTTWAWELKRQQEISAT